MDACHPLFGVRGLFGVGGEAPPGEPYADLLQSHLSVIVLFGDLALKIKKPVRLPFIDLSGVEARRANCVHEFELNRRLAPDVYLGVGELRGPQSADGAQDGDAEPVLVMRRMPRARRLTHLLTAPGQDLHPVLDDVARQIAALHAAQPPVRDFGLAATTARLWEAGHDQLAPFARTMPDQAVLDQEALEEAAGLAAEYLAGRGSLLAERERRGLVRDGHGDLICDDLFCLDDGVRILDCLEFDRELRVNDVLADVAFLGMDLELHGAPHLARWFVDRYREHSGENHPRSLEHHYIAYRAFVRAKVHCLRHAEGVAGAAQAARTRLDLALRQLRAGRVHLVLIGGLPGTGKSTVARALATGSDAREWVWLASDLVRRDLVEGGGSAARAQGYGQGQYDAAHRDATYAELLHRAELALAAGDCVVLDASWTDVRHRQAAVALAGHRSAVLTQVQCVAPPDLAARRLSERVERHGSDADVTVLRAMAQDVAPWPQATPVATTGGVAEAVDAVLRLLEAAPRPPPTLP